MLNFFTNSHEGVGDDIREAPGRKHNFKNVEFFTNSHEGVGDDIREAQGRKYSFKNVEFFYKLT